MPFNNLDLKKIYYYAICVIAFFVLMWGTIDLVSSSVGLLNMRGVLPVLSAPSEEAPLSSEKGEQFFDIYYQRKMLLDRLLDSLARVVVSGLIFGYCRYRVNKLEKRT
ncbi:hypothetical protein AMJ44_07495 [candidate division WOR-1 bacterium DG_54_3]|uniref:Uncharacterized protein n=1 Tax=candidate division WOR-1 bacterium DG_54_3 TaxID=1703775 RepID=A0A0S7XX70_UNCSA|nr:MAG: hypothetical protein AMJ44_07495 [candidate division WOR-1 bacterium DG_54_3]